MYDLAFRGVRSSYYEGTFIVKNTEVDSHLKDVGYHSDNVNIHSS